MIAGLALTLLLLVWLWVLGLLPAMLSDFRDAIREYRAQPLWKDRHRFAREQIRAYIYEHYEGGKGILSEPVAFNVRDVKITPLEDSWDENWGYRGSEPIVSFGRPWHVEFELKNVHRDLIDLLMGPRPYDWAREPVDITVGMALHAALPGESVQVALT